MALGNERVWGVMGISDYQSCVTVKNSLQVLALSASPPLYVPFWSVIRGKERAVAVLSLIGFDFGGTQLPADRTFPARVPVPPASAAKMMATHIAEAAGRYLGESVALENTRGQIDNRFCIACH